MEYGLKFYIEYSSKRGMTTGCNDVLKNADDKIHFAFCIRTCTCTCSSVYSGYFISTYTIL